VEAMPFFRNFARAPGHGSVTDSGSMAGVGRRSELMTTPRGAPPLRPGLEHASSRQLPAPGVIFLNQVNQWMGR